jgi:Uma2 family endonuclease
MENAAREPGRSGGDLEMVATRLMIADELAALPEDGYGYELVRGELRKMPPPGMEHGHHCKRIARPLVEYEDLGLATVFINDTGVWLEQDPDTVRGPDISVFLNEHLPPRPWTSYARIPPVLAVEVKSPFDRRADIEEKIADYLRAGVKLIWYVIPETRQVWVDGAGRDRVVLTEADVLDGSDVLPGLPPISIADIFR